MIRLKESERRTVTALVRRVRNSGSFTLTSPERRIVDASLNVVSGFDWASATWDATKSELTALFDSAVAALSAPGTYYMELRGTIGPERYGIQITVIVENWGP